MQKVRAHEHWTNRIRLHWCSLQFLPLPPFCLLVFHLPVLVVTILEVCHRIASGPETGTRYYILFTAHTIPVLSIMLKPPDKLQCRLMSKELSRFRGLNAQTHCYHFLQLHRSRHQNFSLPNNGLSLRACLAASAASAASFANRTLA